MIFRVNYGSTQLLSKKKHKVPYQSCKMKKKKGILANVKKSTKLAMINCLIFMENEFIIFRDLYLDIFIYSTDFIFSSVSIICHCMTA